jgi:hypothetical protein
MIIILHVERSEKSLLVTVNGNWPDLDMGDCWRSNMIFFGSAWLVALAVLLSVLQFLL